MAEYVNENKPIVFKNETDSDFNVGVGIIFQKSGIYEISINDKTTTVTKISERKTGKWIIEERDSIYGKKYILTCPECGESLSVTDSSLPYEKYCRWCGSYNGDDKE